MERAMRTRWMALASSLCLAASLQVTGTATRAQEPAEVARRLSGRWQMNLDESPQFRPRPQGRSEVPERAVLARASAPAPRLVPAVQRGRGGRGGGGGGQAADPRAMAGARALQAVQQAPQTMTIDATADTVTFTDNRGIRTYQVDNLSVRSDVGDGAQMTTRSRWDGDSLRQEFIVGETRVSHEYEVNDEGTRFEFTLRIANFSGGAFREGKAVYDKVQ